MEMQYKQTVTLSPDQVKKILADHIAKVFALSGDVKVTLEVGMTYEDRPCGSSYPTFKNATCEVVTKGKV
jgi:hypothetical protein